MRETSSNEGMVLGQKYAYATAALMVGIAAYIQLLGIERALLAILFACLALRPSPAPRLEDRRLWAQVGLALGVIMLVIVPTIVVVKFDALREVITALQKLQ